MHLRCSLDSPKEWKKSNFIAGLIAENRLDTLGWFLASAPCTWAPPVGTEPCNLLNAFLSVHEFSKNNFLWHSSLRWWVNNFPEEYHDVRRRIPSTSCAASKSASWEATILAASSWDASCDKKYSEGQVTVGFYFRKKSHHSLRAQHVPELRFKGKTVPSCKRQSTARKYAETDNGINNSSFLPRAR